MKELYLDAELEIVKFSMVDIITTSAETSSPEATDPPEYTYETGENDGPTVPGSQIPGW